VYSTVSVDTHLFRTESIHFNNPLLAGKKLAAWEGNAKKSTNKTNKKQKKKIYLKNSNQICAQKNTKPGNQRKTILWS
jgi:hypothetical protein